MSTVPMVEYAEASGLAKEVFDDILKTRKIRHISNFWRTLATHPATLSRVWREWKEVMAPGRLDVLTKEMIALAVSSTNRSSYCVNAHTAAAMKLGLDQDMLGELMAVVAYFNSVNRLADGYQVEPDIFPPKE